MHPAYSVIFFTCASGAGYGLLIWLALLGAAGQVEPERWLGAVGFGLAFGLITLGLLSSTFHLGHPERAWRAFSQWRSSWLSREGVMAVITYAPAGLAAIGWVAFETSGGLWGLAALLAAACALLTVYCTGMIYASLRTIPQWHNPLVTPLYLVLGLMTGALLANALLHAFGRPLAGLSWLTIGLLVIGLALKTAYWRTMSRTGKTYSAGDATGLGRYGKVRPLDPPHTQPNYVQREMGFHVARKHAQKLRKLAVLLGFLAPLICTALAFSPIPGLGVTATIAAVVFAGAGMALERWLFFAQAQHLVTLYYGAETA